MPRLSKADMLLFICSEAEDETIRYVFSTRNPLLSHLIGYRNIYTVANHVMYIYILKTSKEIDSNLFLWEMDEKRNTDRTSLAGSR